MVAVAVAMIADLDLRFQRAIAEDLPAFLRNPAASLEESDDVSDRARRPPRRRPRCGRGRRRRGRLAASRCRTLGPRSRVRRRQLDQHRRRRAADDDRAPEGGPGRPRRLLDLHLHQLHPHASRAALLARAVRRRGAHDRRRPRARVPVRARDRQRRRTRSTSTTSPTPSSRTTSSATWDAFQNQYWPAKYLIDADGEIRYTHFGEGDYETTEAAIRSLLAEAGHQPGAEARGRGRDRRSGPRDARDLPGRRPRPGLAERPDHAR